MGVFDMEQKYLITRGRVKLFLQQNGMRIANETYAAIDEKLKSILLFCYTHIYYFSRSKYISHSIILPLIEPGL